MKLVAEKKLGPDNLFIHMSAMPDDAWKAVRDAGAGVSVAGPIEMTMRHGMPPILNAMEHGIEPSLSTDVECTMTADFFTQMRSVMTLQRMLVNEMERQAARRRHSETAHGTGSVARLPVRCRQGGTRPVPGVSRDLPTRT